MTVLLVVITFAVFIAFDYLRNRKRIRAAAVQPETNVAGVTAIRPSLVAGFELPENLRYHPGHTWALAESPTMVRAGLDDFAARLVGKCERIQLPERGQWIRQGQKLATLFRDGEKAQVVSPIEGEVTEVNEQLGTDPNLACREPYGAGWFVTVNSPDARTNFRNLLRGSLARRWMAEAASRLRAGMPAIAGAVAQDGGTAVSDISTHLAGQKWGDLTKEFFLL